MAAPIYSAARTAIQRQFATWAPELEVWTNEELEQCGGIYIIESGTANGYPVWQQADGNMLLYSTPNGFWRITDDRADFSRGAGFLITQAIHEGLPPYEMGTRGGWIANGTFVEEVQVIPSRAMEPPNPPQSPTSPIMNSRLNSRSPSYSSTGGAPWSSPNSPPSRRVDESTGAIEVMLKKSPYDNNLGLKFKSVGLSLIGIRENTPAHKADLQQFIGWSLTHVNGQVVASSHELVRATEGITSFKMRFIPPPPDQERENIELCWLAKGEEPLGLQLNDMILTGVHHGSPAHRFGLRSLIGKRLIHVNGLDVHTLMDVAQLTAGLTGLWLGFENIPGPTETNRSYQQGEEHDLSNATRVEAFVEKIDGPLGCWFDGENELVLVEVSPGSAAFESGLNKMCGRTVTFANGVPVSTAKDIHRSWSELSIGEDLSLILEERRFDPHFPSLQRSYTRFNQVYGSEAKKEWEASPGTSNTNDYFEDWKTRRTVERDRARANGIASSQSPPRGDLSARRYLGIPTAAGRPRTGPFGTWASYGPDGGRPTALGPGKS
eukprot:TRINITY_DN6342_c0_g4_i1.p1 TRINITY_DN6342_c0_g4~~TRINITY_DN6342_c0_g4_i1.p1  ORF type:complete len:550 (+),score=72.39 TRINITY_DN6342_c0_g4_i1:46-1695(+)